VISGDYPDKMAIDFLKEAKVKVRKINVKIADGSLADSR
jgi:hypothetical protein